MDEITAVLTIDWKVFIISFAAVVMAAIVIIKAFDFLRQRFGIETKKERQLKEDHQLLLDTSKKLEEVVKLTSEKDDSHEKTLDYIADIVTKLSNSVDEINKLSVANNNATVENLHKTITEKCNFY